jgi:hypothetical protein
MSTKTERKALAAAATALSATGLFVAAPAAQAKPMFPLAPNCVQYGWPGDVQLQHTNGWTARFSAVGPNVNAPASAFHPTAGTLSGTISGGIYGHSVEFEIHWNNGSVGSYTGAVGDDSVARGDTIDTEHPENKAKWNTQFPISCTKTADPQAQAGPQQAPPDRVLAVVVIPQGANYTTVDVYNDVNDQATLAPKGQVPAGSEVAVWGVCGDTKNQVNIHARPSVLTPGKWCHVQGAPVPGGSGYMWGHLAPK